MNPNEHTAVNGSLALRDAAGKLHTRQEFVAFVHGLLRDLRDKPQEWENNNLASYLEALAAWVEDMDGYYQSAGRPVPTQPDWGTLAEMLMAARVYE